MSIKTSNAESAFVSLAGAEQLIKTAANSIVRLHAIDPTFPRFLYITPRKRLLNTAELIAWVNARKDQPPLPSIRPVADAQRRTARTADALSKKERATTRKSGGAR